MCGLTGFIDFNRSSSRDILMQCTDAMPHRGPDGKGYEFFERDNFQLGLGHRRLSIIDLSSAASQPMWYKDLCIIFNGEMYNYAEVRAKLQELGHTFSTQSDTEVILHAWEEWGAEMIHEFLGMYVFVIYDAGNQHLYCFRDRAGVKPFYYYWSNGVFLFASELKALHRHPAFKKEIDQQAVHQYFQYGYIMAPLSIFRHTKKLLPGHYLHFKVFEKEFSLVKYWDVYDSYNKPKLDISASEARAETERLLISACNYRMVADVPVGVFLSGGYDSTVVTALLQAHQPKKVKTYTIGFFEEDHNEAVYAKKVAKHLGTEHTEHYCTAKEAQEIIPGIPYFCDEPFGDSSIIPTTLVSQLARKDVTVALSADAGDEIFAGYQKYPLALDIIRRMNAVPFFIRKPAGKVLQYTPDILLSKLIRHSAVSMKKERFSKILQHKASTTAIMDNLLSQVYTDDQMNGLMTVMQEPPRSFFHSENELNDKLGDLDKLLAIDYKTYLPDDILVKVDRAGMTASLEGREPLLDHRIIEFIAQLPEDLKMRGGNKKFLLKEIVHDYVPREIMERPKMGFGVPVFNWLRTDLKYYAEEYMSEAAFRRHGLFKAAGVKQIMQRFYLGDRNYNSLFWYLLMFQMWYRKWME